MKKLLGTIIISLIGLTFVHGQTLDKSYVDNWIHNTFPKSELDSNVLYVLNGIPFHPNSVNHELSKYRHSDLIQINIIDKRTIDSLMLCRTYGATVLVTTKGMQTKRAIRKNFNQAKNKYSGVKLKTTGDINVEKGEPVLIINGSQVFHKDCYFEINKLKVSRIIGINCIDKPVSLNYYGANGINGLIEIRTE